MKNWLSGLIRGEAGLALPAVLAMMALGSLTIVPMLNLVSTSLNTGETVQKKVEGLYAADAGIENALWTLKNNKPASFPFLYDLPVTVNGMAVSVVIGEVTTLFDYEIDPPGEHVDWLVVTKSIIYDDGPGIYYYTMTIENTVVSNVSIEMILVDEPPDLVFELGSTGGDLTTADPDINGNPTTGITLVWEFSPPYPSIPAETTVTHTFQLSGPPGIAGVEGHGFVRAIREDVGTVWDTESTYPYSITAQAQHAGITVARIKVGVWLGTGGEIAITHWEINP